MKVAQGQRRGGRLGRGGVGLEVAGGAGALDGGVGVGVQEGGEAGVGAVVADLQRAGRRSVGVVAQDDGATDQQRIDFIAILPAGALHGHVRNTLEVVRCDNLRVERDVGRRCNGVIRPPGANPFRSLVPRLVA